MDSRCKGEKRIIPLFSPLTVKNLTLKNRIVMPPMALDIATEKGRVTRRMIDHYCRHARGVGLVIVEHAYVHPEGRVHPHQLGIYEDSLIPGLSKLVARLHQQGVPVGIQLSHGGARSMHFPCAPSNIQSQYLKRYHGKNHSEHRICARKLSIEEISALVEAFAQAAIRAQKAGFDFVELHGAHGYLLNQFYSPLTNIRVDEYGGNLERRLRFPLEVVTAVKRAVGEALPVFYRLGADDHLPNGTTVDDSVRAAVLLEEAGVDCLDLSGGISGYLKEGEEGFYGYLAEAIKPAVSVPVIVTGGIKTGAKANDIVARGIADLVGVGRSLLQNPNWVYDEYQKLTSAPISEVSR